MVKQMIGDFEDGKKVQTYLLVREKNKRLTKAGKTFLSVDFLDRSGSIMGMVWDDADRISECFSKGDAVAVRAVVNSYQGKLQLKVMDIRAVDERDDKLLDKADLYPRTPHDLEEMWVRLTETIKTVGDEHLRGLLTAIFNDEKIGPSFKNATAARNMHHNYIGGLLEHTLSVAVIADFLCGHYGSDINRDIVITGALLHDIGKLRELNSSGDFNYTIEGSLKGHVVIGVGIVGGFAEKIEGFSPGTLLLIEHMIVSHQGQKEWASPVEPKIPEAQILHMADLVDARMFQMIRAIREDKNEDDPFTAKDYALGRSVLKIRDTDELSRLLESE